MRKISKKQAKKNRELAKIKEKMDKRCVICGRYGNDLAHLLPKSIYPEYYTECLNLAVMCRRCHNLYDNDTMFRRKQKRLYEQIKSFDEGAANRYFRMNE